MPEKLKWSTQKRKVSDLKDHASNPRSLSKKSHGDLLKSFEDFDYVELAAIDFDNTILAGHQRIHIMLELGWQDREIEVRVPNRKLTKKENRKYLLVSNKVTGDWDYDILANEFDVDELFDAGFEEKDLIGHIEAEDEDPEVSSGDSEGDSLDAQVKFVIAIPEEDSTSFHNQLGKLLDSFPRAKMEKKK